MIRFSRIPGVAAALLAASITVGNVPTVMAQDAAKRITFWSREGNPERVARTQRNLAEFTKATGIEVELVVVDETACARCILVNAAAKTLPDVVHHPAAVTSRWAKQGLLNADAAAEVVAELRPSTFYENALRAVEVDGKYAAVPIDASEIVVHYRPGLVRQGAGLQPPKTYADILTAAAKLHDPDNKRYGISIATDPGNEAMQTGLKNLALANDCDLVDSRGGSRLQFARLPGVSRVRERAQADTVRKDCSTAWRRAPCIFRARRRCTSGGTATCTGWPAGRFPARDVRTNAVRIPPTSLRTQGSIAGSRRAERRARRSSERSSRSASPRTQTSSRPRNSSNIC